MAIFSGEDDRAVPVCSGLSGQALATRETFQALGQLPPALEWFANLRNPCTRRAYRSDLEDFMQCLGIRDHEQLLQVTRGHVLAWRQQLEQRQLGGSTIRRKLSALAALYDHLCECQVVLVNPTQGVKRPANAHAHEGRTPALSDDQARRLLQAPDVTTERGRRDRALLAVLLYHGLRRAEACALTLGDLQERRGIRHLQVFGKGGKLRYLPLHPAAADALHDYLGDAPGSPSMPLFRSWKDRPLQPDTLYRRICHYLKQAGIPGRGVGAHALRTTAATNALEHDADLAKVQHWLGHANIATTRLYDRREHRVEDSPTFKVRY